MMYKLLSFSLVLALVVAFQPISRTAAVPTRSQTKLDMQMKLNSKAATAAAAALLLGSSLPLNPAYAAQYGLFGGASSAVLNPNDAQIEEITDDVKTGLAAISSYKSIVSSIRSDLAKDPQLDVAKRIADELKVDSMRLALNKFNGAFTEDTQRGTDRLIRLIIQDITELQREALVKKGKPRGPTKVEIVDRRLKAFENSLDQLTAFLPDYKLADPNAKAPAGSLKDLKVKSLFRR